ncbi:MAG TPA: ATP-binding protein, partial [Anaeromyxobacteraceae bacterium]|nr:ATP-binding protein [Anaeromyxobacteraceae bacterium]
RGRTGGSMSSTHHEAWSELEEARAALELAHDEIRRLDAERARLRESEARLGALLERLSSGWSAPATPIADVDVEALHGVERELQRALARHRSHVLGSPLAVVEWSAELRVVAWSPRAEALFGWSADEVMDRPIDEIGWMLEEDRTNVRSEVALLRAHERRSVIHLRRNRRRDGSVIWCEWYTSAVLDPSGRLQSVLSQVLDVTERVRAEEALREASRRKDEFLAKLGHELRNPLAPIRNAWEILRRPGISLEQAHAAREVLGRQIGHLSRIVDDLLDVSRIVEGRLHLSRRPLDLAALVREECEDHRALFAARGLALHVEVGASPVPVSGDSTRLAQVLGNLLQNAARFTDAGGAVTVRLDVDRGTGAAALRVRDTGVGIAPEVIGRLFDPFYQGPQDVARRVGGLGLGLSLARGLVALHGGTIAVSSGGAGRGSEFTVAIPVGEALPPEAPTLTPPPELRHRRILVVEDNADAADTLRQVLELDGHAVEVAGDGVSGLARARVFEPDLVLSDLGLPGDMDGYAFARAVRADPTLAGIPLVALSGYARAEDCRRAREAGFDEHLAKPLPLDALRAVLQGVKKASSAKAEVP